MTSPARILVVDDDPAVLCATVRLLSKAGHTVSEAATGEAAWQMICAQKPDVILLDVVLPDADGFDLCRRIKGESVFADSFVILLSGSRVKSESQAEGLSAGADGYIARPISNSELAARVQAILRIRTVQLELRTMARRQAMIARLGLRALQENDVTILEREIAEGVATTLAASCSAILEFPKEQAAGRVRTGFGWSEDLSGTPWLEPGAPTEEMQARMSAGTVVFGPEPGAGSRLALPPLLAVRGVISGIAAPVHGRKCARAALAVFSVAGREFPVDEVHFLQTMANILSTVMVRQENEAEHHRLEKRIQQGQKLQSLTVLAGGVAHDFNNLLQAILGNAEMAVSSLTDPKAVRADLDEIRAAAERAAELTAQMLAYTGNTLFCAETLDLQAVVSRAVGQYNVKVAPALPIACDVSPAPLLIRGDTAQLEKAIVNLLINATEAVEGTDGTVRIRAGMMDATPDYLAAAILGDLLSPGSCVFLEVTDTGGGMNAETRSRVFEPFFSTKFTGRGLGLPAVLGIMRGHSGAIHVASVPGKGSSFTLLFPRVIRAPVASPRTERP